MEYTPNERIVDRAVELWIEMLREPRYDNLGRNTKESPDSVLANTMASVLASSLPKNNDDQTLQRFGAELKKILMQPTEWESDFGKKEKYTSMFRCLDVDYGPDVPLKMAADRAGLKMEFPWKTTMHLANNSLCISRGYRAEYVYHYPLQNGEWFVTTLQGEDVSKIIDLIEAGYLTKDLQATD